MFELVLRMLYSVLLFIFKENPITRKNIYWDIKYFNFAKRWLKLVGRIFNAFLIFGFFLSVFNKF